MQTLVLNYRLMRMRRWSLTIVLGAMLLGCFACAHQEENGATSKDTNKPNPPSAAQPSTSVPKSSPGTATAVAPIDDQRPTAIEPQAAAQAATLPPLKPETVVAATSPATTPPGLAPKILVASTKMDFGKQPGNKTIQRAIIVRNAGKSNLNIESVTPS